MPVLLDRDGVDEWIGDDDFAPLHLLRPAPNKFLSFLKVSTAVNSTRNRGPQLIQEIPADPTDSGDSETLL
jgi:putative SOS response-associated peptidase YedK